MHVLNHQYRNRKIDGNPRKLLTQQTRVKWRVRKKEGGFFGKGIPDALLSPGHWVFSHPHIREQNARRRRGREVAYGVTWISCPLPFGICHWFGPWRRKHRRVCERNYSRNYAFVFRLGKILQFLFRIRRFLFRFTRSLRRWWTCRVT